jgi:hypothetical protein
VTRGNVAKLAATAFVALLMGLLSVRVIGYKGEQFSGGESVSQSLLKDRAFSTFLDQNPPFELRPKMGLNYQLTSEGSSSSSAHALAIVAGTERPYFRDVLCQANGPTRAPLKDHIAFDKSVAFTKAEALGTSPVGSSSEEFDRVIAKRSTSGERSRRWRIS